MVRGPHWPREEDSCHSQKNSLLYPVQGLYTRGSEGRGSQEVNYHIARRTADPVGLLPIAVQHVSGPSGYGAAHSCNLRPIDDVSGELVALALVVAQDAGIGKCLMDTRRSIQGLRSGLGNGDFRFRKFW